MESLHRRRRRTANPLVCYPRGDHILFLGIFPDILHVTQSVRRVTDCHRNEKQHNTKLSESSPAFLKWIQGLLMDILVNEDDVLVDISSPKAEKRYLAFIKKMPELFNSVPLKEIAGYIGVTPQSLSRIRAGLNKKQIEKKVTLTANVLTDISC